MQLIKRLFYFKCTNEQKQTSRPLLLEMTQYMGRRLNDRWTEEYIEFPCSTNIEDIAANNIIKRQ